MKSTNLAQSVAVRLLDLDERVTDLISKADKLASAVEYARNVIGNKIEVDRAKYAQVQSGFPALYAEAQAARQRADLDRGILQDIRSWIADLPHHTKLCVVQPPAGDHELGVLQARLKAMRAELQQLTNITVPADNLTSMVQAYVLRLAAQGRPTPRGYGQGQQLDVRWPDNPLSLFALMMPDKLTEVITHAVQATLPMDKVELEKRRSVLPGEIDELSYTVAALRERAGEPPDPAMSPWHWLGVRTKDEEASPRQQIRA